MQTRNLIPTLILAMAMSGACTSTEPEETAFKDPAPASDQKESSPVDNPAEAFNAAWVELFNAQRAYDALGATDKGSAPGMTPDWFNDVSEAQLNLRAAWLSMKAEADALSLPNTFSRKGEMSRGTVDEYMDAYGDFLSLQEASLYETDECVQAGDTLEWCLTEGAFQLFSDEQYLEAYERLRSATFRMYEEAQQPPS